MEFQSAADNRDFLFNKAIDPRETRNVVSSPFSKDVLGKIKTALIEHLKENGETAGIKNDNFIAFDVPSFINDPDQGHLIQDGYTPWGEFKIPGYTN